jgi:uncharacterized protein DUF1569
MNSHLERLRKELESTLSGVTPVELAKAPEGKWSSEQVLEHLWLTYKNTNKGLAKCLQGGAPLATVGTFKHRVKTFVVVSLRYLPNGNKAPERALPQGVPCDDVLRSIYPELAEMDARFAECEKRFGPRTKILDHPILGPLSAPQWRVFHLLHGQHHARQIRGRLGKA